VLGRLVPEPGAPGFHRGRSRGQPDEPLARERREGHQHEPGRRRPLRPPARPECSQAEADPRQPAHARQPHEIADLVPSLPGRAAVAQEEEVREPQQGRARARDPGRMRPAPPQLDQTCPDPDVGQPPGRPEPPPEECIHPQDEPPGTGRHVAELGRAVVDDREHEGDQIDEHDRGATPAGPPKRHDAVITRLRGRLVREGWWLGAHGGPGRAILGFAHLGTFVQNRGRP
jgi:hypothetical protein